jgi:hypothetical protein
MEQRMTARKLPRSGLVQPLIHLPFCPDNTLLAGFSGSFAGFAPKVVLGQSL